jgi:amino acid adenylation domain-containing protein
VCLGRSTKLAVALLGILKSGAACLPLDPSYPPPRLEFMLRDSGAQLVVADAERAVQFAATGARVVLVDADGDAIARESGSSFDVGGEKDDLAYVLYTSGSTGEPRGVALTHRGLANHVIAATELYGIGPDDRVLQFASISFDMSLEETFVSWVAAATLVFRSETLPLLGREFWDWLRREGITILDLPTTYWHAWVDDLCDLGVAIPETIRVVVVGGDRALVDSYRRWLTIGGDRVRWFNTYGPTEASVIATAYEGPRTAEAVPDEIPIGRPLPNVRVYVLDRHLRPVPIGVPGELYVGGIGVARAYLNRPELTAERFILDVFTSASDAVMYRTGDIVRFLPSGDLVFVGRTDDQVKIRGFRVEPAEVEAALQDHPRVRQALVLAHEFAVERRLVAYTVADAGTDSPDPEELRRFLASRIPDFMIPAAFVGLDAFPLTASGKIDRDALPNPDLPQDVEFVAPRTATEETLAAIWREVLGLANVGVTYNFFALGGHSLLAMQVIARARQAFGVDVRLRSIFDAPTIAELARALETAPELQPQLEPKLIPVARQGLRLEESRPRRAVIGE